MQLIDSTSFLRSSDDQRLVKETGMHSMRLNPCLCGASELISDCTPHNVSIVMSS